MSIVWGVYCVLDLYTLHCCLSVKDRYCAVVAWVVAADYWQLPWEAVWGVMILGVVGRCLENGARVVMVQYWEKWQVSWEVVWKALFAFFWHIDGLRHSGGFRGVRGVQMHRPLWRLVMYFCVRNCTSPSNVIQQWHATTTTTRHSYTLMYQFLTDL